MPEGSAGNAGIRDSARARVSSAWHSCGATSSASGAGGPSLPQTLKIRQQPRRNRLAREVPDDRAELGVLVEDQPVVDGEDAPRRPEEAVPALAVGIVGEEVEEADAAEGVVVRRVLHQAEVVLFEVGMDEELERPLTVRPLARDGKRDQPPAERFREHVGGELALPQAWREIPQPALTRPRLGAGR